MGTVAGGRAQSLVLSGEALSIREVEGVSRGGWGVSLGPDAQRAMTENRRALERALADGRAHYGVNTGFGSLARRRIADADLKDLQRNLVRSHAAGAGVPLPVDVVRATMLLLAASLARGRSGARPIVAQRLAAMLDAGVTPIVPERGSVGASGDLAPLAHVALVLIGEGEAEAGGARMDGGEALRRAGLEPLALESKEGLALINGTHLMAARGALLCADFERLVAAAVLAAAMSIDAARGTDAHLDERAHAVRNQPGPMAVAASLRSLLAGSQIVASHRENDPRVQDPYSLRCAPAVLGAALDAYLGVRRAVRAELGAVTDNPLVFAEEGGAPAIVAAGNFHGMPIALPLDVLSIAVAHVAGISERRTFHMLSALDPESGLTPHLSPVPGLHSGLMVAQYTAAACCNELASLAGPATVTNLPTCAGVEDYNSFGPHAASKAARAIELARDVVAIELLAAAQGIETHRPLRSGDGVERGMELVREVCAPLTQDRPLSGDIARLAAAVGEGRASVILARSDLGLVLADPAR